MAHPEYIQPGIYATAAHAAEEAGELIQALGKLMRFGPYSVNPELPVEQQEENFIWLVREWTDLVAAMDRLTLAIQNDDTPHIQFTPKKETV